MTTDERTKVEALCRKLFPSEAPPPIENDNWDAQPWEARLWDAYWALLEAELI